MCSDVNDVEDGELDEDDDYDAAMASPSATAKVSDQGWKKESSFNYLEISRGRDMSCGFGEISYLLSLQRWLTTGGTQFVT